MERQMNALTSRLKAIEEQLLAEREGIDRRLSELDAERSTVSMDRERIVACLAAMGVKPKPAKGATSKGARPCAGQKEVAEIVRELLNANGPMDAEDLMELTKSRIAESGKSLAGFGLRFAEVRERHLKEASPGVLALLEGSQRKSAS
jgi:hypothetical protein